MKFFKQINLYYIVTLLFLFLSCNANFLSSSDVAWFMILLGFIGIAIQRNMITSKDFGKISVFSGVFLFYVIVRDLFINGLETTFLVGDIAFLFKYIYLAFIFCVILKDKALAYLVKVITHLTAISFFFYFFQLIAGDLMYDIFKLINLPNDNVLSGNLNSSYSNILIFTYTRDFHNYANSGFVWEPGSFGCFLVLALMYHFFLNNFKFDRAAIILIIGNITTFSTTNYMGLIVLLFMVYRYRVPKINLWVVVALIVGVVLVITIPFLGQKIIGTYEEDLADLKHLRVLERYYHHYRMQIPLNRFASMIYIFDVFNWKLILGVSNKYSLIFYRTFNINVSNGVFDFLAKFGLVGLVYLLYNYGRLCYRFLKSAELVAYAIFMLIVLGFGEPIMILPFILIFLFLSVSQTEILKRYQMRFNQPGLVTP